MFREILQVLVPKANRAASPDASLKHLRGNAVFRGHLGVLVLRGLRMGIGDSYDPEAPGTLRVRRPV